MKEQDLMIYKVVLKIVFSLIYTKTNQELAYFIKSRIH